VRQIKNFVTRDKIKSDLEQIDYQPDSIDNLHDLATRYVIERDYESCLETLLKIEELYGSDTQSLLNQSICLIRLSRLEEAIQTLSRAIEFNPEFIEGLKLKSVIEEKIDRLRKYVFPVYQ